jgi:hypothetical protein
MLLAQLASAAANPHAAISGSGPVVISIPLVVAIGARGAMERRTAFATRYERRSLWRKEEKTSGPAEACIPPAASRLTRHRAEA